MASTAPSDLPGVRQAWSKEDRVAYVLAVRAPWLLRAYLGKVRRDVRKDAAALLSMFGRLAAPDQAVLARPGMPEAFQHLIVQSMAHGSKGAALDFALEARPWGLPLSAVRADVDVWHGEEDTLVSPEQGKILARALPSAELHLLPGEAHLSLRFDHAAEVLERLA